jgi:hypothetical protein
MTLFLQLSFKFSFQKLCVHYLIKQDWFWMLSKKGFKFNTSYLRREGVVTKKTIQARDST